MSSSFSVFFFQGPTQIFVRLASPNVNMGPYGKTTRVPLTWWVLYLIEIVITSFFALHQFEVVT